MLYPQTNINKIAELLVISNNEAFQFYSEVRQRFQPVIPTSLILTSLHQSLLNDSNSKPTSQELVGLIAKQETAAKFTIVDVKPKQEPKLPAAAKSSEAVVLISYPPRVEPQPDWALKFRLEFSRRLNKAYEEVAGEYCVQKGVKPFHLDEDTRAELKFDAINRIYTEEDASNHRDMEYFTEFLRSSYWTTISDFLRRQWRRYRDQCLRCGTNYPDIFDVHHKSYANHGREHEHLDDLEVICRRCHQNEEQKKRDREHRNRY